MAVIQTINPSSVNLIDESFDVKKSNQYHLSILYCETRLAYAVLDTQTNKYIVLKEAQDTANLSLFGETSSWASVSCAVAHHKFTLIPNSLFDEEKKESLLGFNHPVGSGEEIISNRLSNLDAQNLFTISKKIKEKIQKQFINTRFIHNSTSFIEGLLLQNKNNTGKKVFADFHSAYFEIVILDGRELLFSNAFSYKTPEDIAYYILFVYEQLHLNTETIELVLSGKIEKTAKEHSLLYTYIKHIKFGSLPESFNFSYKFDEIPPYKFFSLFTQYLCA